ncbi:DUF7535 family protein [Haloferacaceae archaeon DSL9]
MSSAPASQRSDESSAATKLYRTVSPRYHSHPDSEMNLLGWLYFAGLLVLLLPLLPAIAVIWVADKVVTAIRRRRAERM